MRRYIVIGIIAVLILFLGAKAFYQDVDVVTRGTVVLTNKVGVLTDSSKIDTAIVLIQVNSLYPEPILLPAAVTETVAAYDTAGLGTIIGAAGTDTLEVIALWELTNTHTTSSTVVGANRWAYPITVMIQVDTTTETIKDQVRTIELKLVPATASTTFGASVASPKEVGSLITSPGGTITLTTATYSEVTARDFLLYPATGYMRLYIMTTASDSAGKIYAGGLTVTYMVLGPREK